MATLADAARTYLIASTLVRDPRTAGSLPPAWRQPADGVPAPGEGTGVEVGSNAVVGLIVSGGISAPRFEPEWRRDILDVWIRVRKWPDAEALYASLRAALIGSTFTKTNWMMGGMRIIESIEWRPHQMVDSNSAQGFTSQFAVMFQTYTPDHF
jgi:hypothetical protein